MNLTDTSLNIKTLKNFKKINLQNMSEEMFNTFKQTLSKIELNFVEARYKLLKSFITFEE